MSPIRVLIADDHAVIREGLRLCLAEEPLEFEVVGQATNGLEAVSMAEQLKPDVILMDLVMPQLDGIGAIRRLSEAGDESRIVVLTTFADDDNVRQAIQAGVIGYLMKDVRKPELLSAIRAAADGRPTLHPEAQQRLMSQVAAPPQSSPFDALTARERDVLRLIAAGHSNKAIAARLSLTLGTVKGYVSTVFSKLGVADRTQAALLATRHGLGAS
jgi:DNA-binding NarL/FixJ family response regulator